MPGKRGSERLIIDCRARNHEIEALGPYFSIVLKGAAPRAKMRSYPALIGFLYCAFAACSTVDSPSNSVEASDGSARGGTTSESGGARSSGGASGAAHTGGAVVGSGAAPPTGGAGSLDSGIGADAAGSGGTAASGGATASGGTRASGGAGASDATTAVTGCIVPLYTDPGDTSWSTIVLAKSAHPRVPVVAIVNPNSGPGSAPSTAYTAGIASLTTASIRTIGYVHTSYGARAASAVRDEIDHWHSWYPQVTGIFFDEESNDPGGDGYYRDLSAYTKSLGIELTVGNPGTDTSASYIGAVDVTFVYESKGLPSDALLTDWRSRYPLQSIGVIPYASALDLAWVSKARSAAGYIYVTDDDLPNPWDSLPSFFDDLLAALD
jgi:hypothetical protein